MQPGDTVFANFPVGFALADTRFGSTHLQLHSDFELQPGRGYQTGFNYAIIIAPGSYDNTLPPDDSLLMLGAFENNIARVRIVTPAKNKF